MVRYRLEYPALYSGAPGVLSFEVPDMHTALTVAELNVARGPVRILAGDRPLATVERRGRGHRSFWYVAPALAQEAAGSDPATS